MFVVLIWGFREGSSVVLVEDWRSFVVFLAIYKLFLVEEFGLRGA